jgi:hypothetical protein
MMRVSPRGSRVFAALTVVCFTATLNLVSRISVHEQRINAIENAVIMTTMDVGHLEGISATAPAQSAMEQHLINRSWTSDNATSSQTFNVSEQNASELLLLSMETNLNHQTSGVFDPTKYAYAAMIAGCDPDNGSYRGYLYSVLVGTRILRQQGARADMVLLIQMSSQSNATVLPDNEVRILTAMGIHIVYVPKKEANGDSMYDAVMDKFFILSLTQYRRVLIMDGDVLPLASLDYLFQLSDDDNGGPNALLKENVVVQGVAEPANGGFYMLAPGVGEYEQLLDIVRTRELEAANLTSWPKFDEVRGWGHVLADDDPWQARRSKGSKWNFHFAFADQGLLYHWTKYVKRSVSIIGHRTVWNWAAGESETSMVLESEHAVPFNITPPPRIYNWAHCAKYMCDFVHYTGEKKPWLRHPPADLGSNNDTRSDNDPTLLWWNTLYELNHELDMNINFTHWQPRAPPLGYYATYHQVERRIERRKVESNSTTRQTKPLSLAYLR